MEEKQSLHGSIVAGVLAPHPPHLVYAENPPQNQPRAECGWEALRWGYADLRKSLAQLDYDSVLILSPHWRTYVGTHVLAVPKLASLSVDPVFPHLFRYSYHLTIDMELAESLHREFLASNLVSKKMENPDFRVDYGTIVSGHMTDPQWKKPVVVLSSHAAAAYFGPDVMMEEFLQLGRATRRAIEKSGKKVLLLASQSLSHRHFTSEPEPPEDMHAERIYNHHQYLWDMKMLELMRQGKSQEILDLMPDFVEQAVSESDSGALIWMLEAMGRPQTPAQIFAYGTVIGTGNAIAQWRGPFPELNTQEDRSSPRGLGPFAVPTGGMK